MSSVAWFLIYCMELRGLKVTSFRASEGSFCSVGFGFWPKAAITLHNQKYFCSLNTVRD